MNMKKILFAMAAIAALLSCAGGNNDKNAVEDPFGGPVVEMTTTKGDMKIQLYNLTPKHRDNFVKLAREGYFDGMKFHRVIEGFMIQGGDPLSKDDSLRTKWGEGGPGYSIEAEFRDTLHHCKGALAAARLGDLANPRKASSGSQFYIVQDEEGCRHLDGEYTVYGQVIEGLDVIDAIACVETDAYDRPLVPVVITKVSVVEVEASENADSEAETTKKAEGEGEPASETKASEKAEAASKEPAPISQPAEEQPELLETAY